MTSQSNTVGIVMMALVGTTSMFLGSQVDGEYNHILPSKSYPYAYEENQQMDTLLQYEIMETYFENTVACKLVEMPVIKRIKVKFNKPIPLEFISVENENGFIA